MSKYLINISYVFLYFDRNLEKFNAPQTLSASHTPPRTRKFFLQILYLKWIDEHEIDDDVDGFLNMKTAKVQIESIIFSKI